MSTHPNVVAPIALPVTAVAQAMKMLDAAEALLAAEPLALTALEKRRLAKMRKGGDQVVRTLAPLATEYGLASSTLDSQTMVARLADAQALLPLQQRIVMLSKRVDDLVFRAHADAWLIALEFYAVLRRKAATNGDVAVALASVQQFFAYRHPSTGPGTRQRRANAKARAARKVLGLAPGAGHAPENPALAAPDPAPAPEPGPSDRPSATPSPAPVAVNGVTNGSSPAPPARNGQPGGHA
jgi:hypothetical protein